MGSALIGIGAAQGLAAWRGPQRGPNLKDDDPVVVGVGQVQAAVVGQPEEGWLDGPVARVLGAKAGDPPSCRIEDVEVVVGIDGPHPTGAIYDHPIDLVERLLVLVVAEGGHEGPGVRQYLDPAIGEVGDPDVARGSVDEGHAGPVELAVAAALAADDADVAAVLVEDLDVATPCVGDVQLPIRTEGDAARVDHLARLEVRPVVSDGAQEATLGIEDLDPVVAPVRDGDPSVGGDRDALALVSQGDLGEVELARLGTVAAPGCRVPGPVPDDHAVPDPVGAVDIALGVKHHVQEEGWRIVAGGEIGHPFECRVGHGRRRARSGAEGHDPA